MYNTQALTTGDKPMVRPRKVGGRRMPANMYLMPGHGKLPEEKQRFRYKLENGKYKGIRGEDGQLAPYELAKEIAEEANNLRESMSTSSITSLLYWQEKYQEWAESSNPKLKEKASWVQRCNDMRSLGKVFRSHKTKQIELSDIEPWWDGLTYDQQHNRRAAFSKWFLWMLNKGLVSCNPFANSHDRPCLINKAKPQKKRLPLEIHEFWAIYNSAGELSMPHVQIAMGVGLVTMMRESDICSLRFDTHIIGNLLRKSINKSVEQRGHTGASHLEFDLNKHLLLKTLINRARELSLKHQRCPYIVSYTPKQKRLGKTKEHTHQVTPKKLIDDFAIARDATGLWDDIKEGRSPPTFHEIKGDSINEAKRYVGKRGYSEGDIVGQAAHADGSVTASYNANHEPVWQPANVVFDEEMIGGKF